MTHNTHAPPLWSAADLSVALDQTITFSAHGLSIDTRTLKSGDLFIALAGKNYDGAQYAKKALEKGAAGAIVPITYKNKFNNEPEVFGDQIIGDQLVYVDDTQQTLVALAKHRRAHTKATLMAITGSYGKTTTKEAFYHAFSHFLGKGSVHATKGNYNNHIGLPLTLASLPLSAHLGIFELGMNNPGEIRDLVKLLKPHLGFITTIGPVHLEYFKNIDQIAAAKSELIEGIIDGGNLCIAHDIFDEYPIFAQKCRDHAITPFTFGAPHELNPLEHKNHEMGCTLTDPSAPAHPFDVSAQKLTTLPSVHLPAAIATAAWIKDWNLSKIANIFNNFSLSAGRGAIYDLTIGHVPITIIDDAYNASIDPLRLSIKRAQKNAPKRLVLVLGDILELGPQSLNIHRQLIPILKQLPKSTLLVTVGDNMCQVAKDIAHHLPNQRCLNDATPIKDFLLTAIEPHDTILFKGSNGIKLHQVVACLKDLSTQTP
jgi:UDP-N-acetylmuramoyl-tripeptide--D-alanyl-D-alanine ligase